MTLIEQVALIDKRFPQLRLRRAYMFAQRNAAAIARLQARGLADPTLGPFGTAHAMNAMASRMASLVFVYGLDMSFDALAEMLLQLGPMPCRSPTTPFLAPAPGSDDEMWEPTLKVAGDGYANPEDVDKVWRIATGAPLGPFQIYDGIGLITPYNILSHGDERDRHIARWLKDNYIDAGKLGVTTGAGFYRHSNDK
jgi:hypothetical protein